MIEVECQGICLFFANFAVDNKILNHYNMKAKVVDNRYLFF